MFGKDQDPNIGKNTQFSETRQPEENGRIPGKSFKSIINELLDLQAAGKVLSTEEIQLMSKQLGRQVTYREALSIRLLGKALGNPDSRSMERILDRAEGKPTQSIELTGDLKTNQVNLPDNLTFEQLKELAGMDNAAAGEGGGDTEGMPD